ncbi:ketopantoate hydroxymethyltransferase [Paenibacillus lautus]|uniref:ketopantoate hydroxymethyltransferase n=1 Tax=Paenibacillus lautus TaxID=1401 RepID=UPI00384B5E92
MITAELLHDVAEYVNSRVANVVINGTYTITNFDVKAVTDNVLALNYIVPVAEVSLITLVELKDADDNVLTSDPVNVPIAADHLMLQTIEVKEAQ